MAFRKHPRLPLDDCLYALQPTIAQLTRSALHRCFQRHGISRLHALEASAVKKKMFKTCPIGYFHIGLTEVLAEQGDLCLFIAVDRTSKFAFVRLVEKATRRTAGEFLEARI